MPVDVNNPRPWEALPKWPRRAMTCWLLFHLFAVITAPASVAPASDLSRAGWDVCRPYLQALYLNHGYHFFAPDPGESTLLAFTVEKADGTTREGTIPHRRIWPRLLYHRHFMLTESLGFIAGVSDREQMVADARSESTQTPTGQTSVATASDQPGTLETSKSAAASTAPERPPLSGLLRNWYQSYARCILDQYGGQRVRLTRVVHYLPEIEWMQESLARGEPLTLNEPQSFEEFPIGTFDAHGGPIEQIDGTPGDHDSKSDEQNADPTDLVLTPTAAGGQP